MQLAMLKRTATLVYHRTSTYRAMMERQGVRPEHIRSLEDLRLLPFTTKQDLQEHYPSGMWAVSPRAVSRIHATSGTTSKPVLVPYTDDDMEQWGECVARTFWAAGVRHGDICLVALGMGLFTGGMGHVEGARKIGCAVIPSGSGMTERQVSLLRDLRATVLVSTPSYAVTIADKALSMGLDLGSTSLRLGSFGAEPLTPQLRTLIESRLGIQAVESYGLAELMGPGVAMACQGDCGGLHINEDHVLAEVVDPRTLKPLPPGELGELVLTSLQRQAMPLLRYRTRDMTSLSRRPCSCGRTLITMSPVVGRSDDMMNISGLNVFPSQLESLLLEVPGVEPFYLFEVHKKGSMDALTIQVEASPHRDQDEQLLVRRISHKIKGTVGLKPTVLVRPRGTLPRFQGKSYRVLDSRKPKP